MADVLKSEQDVKNILVAVREAAQKRSWVAFGYVGEDTTLSVTSQGTGGLAEVEPLLENDKVLYILYGYVAAEAATDASETVIEKLKYILITFVGQQVKPFHRARSTQHRTYLYNFAQTHIQLAGEMQALNKDEVTEHSVAQKLSGSRLEQHVDSTDSQKLTSGRTVNKGQDKLHFANEAASIAAIKSIRNDSDPLRWVAWRYQSDDADAPDALAIIASNTGGYSEVAELLKPGTVVFALLALNTKSEGNYASTKYTLITWVSHEGVKPIMKARSAQDRLQLHDLINQHLQLSAEWQATTMDEISEEKLLHKLQGSIIQEEKAVSSEPRGKATINDGISKVNPDFKPNTSKVAVDWDTTNTAGSEEASTTALQAIRDAKLNWVLFGYAGTSNKVSLLEKGNGGWSEIDPKLDDKTVYYAVVGIPFGVGDYTQTKYIFLNWVGSKAKPTTKARSSQHRIALYSFASAIFPIAGEMQALSRDECSDELMRKKLIGTTQLSEEQQQLSDRSATPSPGPSGESGVEKFELVNPEAIEATVKRVRDDTNEVNWATFAYTDDGSYKIQLDQHGNGGSAEVQKLLKDDIILYILIGVVQSDVDYQTIKYLFVTYIGPTVKPLHKARSSQHRVKMYNHLGQFLQLAGELQILSSDELNDHTLISKVAGTRVLTPTAAKATNRRATVSKGSMEKFTFADEDGAKAALEDLRKDGGKEWVLFGSPEGKNDVIAVLATGKGQLDEVKSHFGEDQVRYAVISFKVVEVVEEVDYTRAKNIFISWIGPEVKPLAKARSSQQRVPVYEYCLKVLPMHGQIHAEKHADLDKNSVLEKFSGARTQDEDKMQKEASRLKELESAANQREKPAESENKVDISTFFKQSEQVIPLLKQLRAGSLTYVALGYLPEDDTTVVLINSGNTDLNTVKDLMKDDSVLYAVVAIKEDNRDAVHQENDSPTLESYATTKFVQINWVGADVKPLQKARSSQHRVALATQLFNAHLQLSAELPAIHRDEVTEVTLRDKITGSRVKA